MLGRIGHYRPIGPISRSRIAKSHEPELLVGVAYNIWRIHVGLCMYDNKGTLICFNVHACVRNVQCSFSYEGTVGGDVVNIIL